MTSWTTETLMPWMIPTGNALRQNPVPLPIGQAPTSAGTPAAEDYPVAGWRRLDLPHDWGIEGPFDPALPGETARLPWAGIGWYRKTFQLPANPPGTRTFLDVDGAMSYATVWCNGQLLGGWPYGYTSWRLELTPALRHPGPNVLAIRVANPPDSSRWYPGGGIYRHVWLAQTPAIAIDHWGVGVTTPEVSAARATIVVSTRITNATSQAASVQVRHELIALDDAGNPQGAPAASIAPETVLVPANGSATASGSAAVMQPALWAPAHPHRYQVITHLQQGETDIDRVTTTCGIRSARFSADQGFQLNGERVRIQGVCLHHDLGALGTAFNVRAAERQLQLLREVGCNAIRTSHNPPAPEFLDLCDRLGFLVMDEFSDTWTIAKKPHGYAPLFADWSEPDIRAMVRRDRNHPSVILWSIGNEIGEQVTQDGPAIAKRLSALVEAVDPSRPTGVGCDKPAAGENGVHTAVSVMGYNYKPHLYAGFRRAHPTQPLLGSETASCVSSRGIYGFPVSDDQSRGEVGIQVSSYDLYAPPWASAPDVEFHGQDQTPGVAGEFVWTGFDYLGEPTPFNADPSILTNFTSPAARAKAEAELAVLRQRQTAARSSYFGIFDLAGLRKDRFYLYQARWRPDLPLAHILPHWTWPGREGEITPIHVYTSGDAAELFLNGQSLGRKVKGPHDYRLRWDDVRYAPGTVVVRAYRNGQPWAEDQFTTAGAPTRIEMAVDRPAIRSDARDLAFITVRIADAADQLVPTANLLFQVDVQGPGSLVAIDNGDATDLTTFSAPSRRTFNGLAVVIVRRASEGTAPLVVTCTSAGLPSASVAITAAPSSTP